MKVPYEFDLDWYGAFDILLKELDMEWINNDDNFEIKNGKVYANGKVVDDRADLFAALRNVQNAQIPNLEFRSDPYITHYCDEEDE